MAHHPIHSAGGALCILHRPNDYLVHSIYLRSMFGRSSNVNRPRPDNLGVCISHRRQSHVWVPNHHLTKVTSNRLTHRSYSRSGCTEPLLVPNLFWVRNMLRSFTLSKKGRQTVISLVSPYLTRLPISHSSPKVHKTGHTFTFYTS